MKYADRKPGFSRRWKRRALAPALVACALRAWAAAPSPEAPKAPVPAPTPAPAPSLRPTSPARPATPAPARKAPRSPWTPVVEEAARAGIERQRLDRIVAQFQRLAVPPERGREILLPALEAARSGLPSRTVLNRINEGLLKRVPPEAIAAASRMRLQSLRGARGLLLSTWGPVSSKQGNAFITSVALAAESGLPPQVLSEVLTRGRGRNPAQVKSVIEAGEALQLAGFDPEVSLALMRDCLERNLRHPDVLKVVKFAVERKRQGLDDRNIREVLWGPRGGGPRPSGAPPTRPPARELPPSPAPEPGPRAGGP